MTVFYRGRYAFITHEVFEVRFPVCESFPIRELGSIQIVQDGPKQLTAGFGWAGIVTAMVASGAVPTTVVVWQVTGSPNYVVLGVLLATASVTIGCLRRQQPFELLAIFRGQSICLLRTTDKRELGQVSRALLRAKERSGGQR